MNPGPNAEAGTIQNHNFQKLLKQMNESYRENRRKRPRRIVIAGGRGHLGGILARYFDARGDEVVVLTRRPEGYHGPGKAVRWDGVNAGAWTGVPEGADAVINLAGRSVDCRYSEANRRAIMDSRVESTRAVGRALAAADRPPGAWLQMSTATIYAHTHGEPQDEGGRLGGMEPGVPPAWRFSIDVARAWERTAGSFDLPRTRTVLMRTAMVMSTARGAVFDRLFRMARSGLGGQVGDGRQYVSWIHEIDFARTVDRLLEDEAMRGTVNLASPRPLPFGDFMHALRRAAGVRFGLPAPKWMVEVGCFLLRTESELVLKSRRVVSGRLAGAGFRFAFPGWEEAAVELAGRWRSTRAGRDEVFEMQTRTT